MFHTLPTLAFILDIDGLVTDVTDMLAARRRLPRSEIIGKHSMAIWPNMARHFENHALAFASPGKAFEALERDEESGLWWRARRRADENRLFCFVEDASAEAQVALGKAAVAFWLSKPSGSPVGLTERDSSVLRQMLAGDDVESACANTGAMPAEAISAILRAFW